MPEHPNLKVIFFHNNISDYLEDGLFHGLRSLLGSNCVDVPRYDCMYAPLPEGIRAKLRGRGFTLYGLLEDMPELAAKRFYWQKEIHEYDLICVGNPWFNMELLADLIYLLKVDLRRIVVLDGTDTPAIFPYGNFWRKLKQNASSYFFPMGKLNYGKRELWGGGYSYSLDRLLPARWHCRLPVPRHVFPLSFSIPAEKICYVDPAAKCKEFPRHIVDREVAEAVRGSFHSAIGSDSYTFTQETDYYADLQASRFGITTMRAGWDCLRHYELAANGCVLCFRDLDRKPPLCAPHGLNEGNCIPYRSYADLRDRLDRLSAADYGELQAQTYRWIERHTTVNKAKELLAYCGLATGDRTNVSAEIWQKQR